MSLAGLGLLLALALVACGGSDDVDLRAGETVFEAPTFRVVVPAGWTATLDDDPSALDQVNLREDGAPGQRAQAMISRFRIDTTPPAGGRLGEPHGDVDGEQAWIVGGSYGRPPDTHRTANVRVDRGGSRYDVFFEAPTPRFEDRRPALERILETLRFG